MGLLGDIGKVILGGAIGGPVGALVPFAVEHGGEAVEGTIDFVREVVEIGKDVYRAIPPEAFALSASPLHGLLKHVAEDELILIGEIAGEAAILSGLAWPVLGPIGASIVIAEGGVPLFVAAGSLIGKLHHRQLNAQELEMARYVFRDSLGDHDQIVLTNLGNPFTNGGAFVWPSTFGSILVNLGNKYIHDATVRDGQVLLHELTHVWQARRRVLREVFFYDVGPDAVTKDYDFEPPTSSSDRQWSSYGSEHQGGIVEAWAQGSTRKSGGSFDAVTRRPMAMGSPLFRYINGNIRRSSDDAQTGSGQSVEQLLDDGRHPSVRPMHPPPPPIWWLEPTLFAPTVVSFGSVPLGQIDRRTLTITNSADALIHVSFPASVAGDVFSWAAFDDDLASGEARTVELTFQPASSEFTDAAINAVRTVVDSGATSSHQVTLSGKGPGGLPPPGPDLPDRLFIGPNVLAFGPVTIGGSRTLTFRIANETGAPKEISVAPPPPGSAFEWQPFDRRLAHGEKRIVAVTFRPSSNAVVKGTVMVASNTSASPQSVGLLGKGPGGFPV
jgi:hypothetical protein